MRRLLTALFIATLVFGSTAASCKGTVAQNPTQTQIDQVRTDTIKIADAITTSLGIYDGALTFANEQNKAGQFDTATLRDLATIGKTFSATANRALDELGEVGTNPNLANTAKVVVDDLDPLIRKLEASSATWGRAFGLSLRVGLAVLLSYVGGV